MSDSKVAHGGIYPEDFPKILKRNSVLVLASPFQCLVQNWHSLECHGGAVASVIIDRRSTDTAKENSALMFETFSFSL